MVPTGPNGPNCEVAGEPRLLGAAPAVWWANVMTIGKGTTWGTAGPLDDGAPVVNSDAALRAIAIEHLGAGHPPPMVGLTGGSLWRTVGGPAVPNRLSTSEAMHLPIDVIEVRIDETLTWFVSRLIARDRRRHRWLVAMNSQFEGVYQLGPRAHPGDGLVDVFQATLALSELAKVAKRARHGAHLPHPDVTERRAAHHLITLDRALPVWLDGERVARGTTVELTVLADAMIVVV